MTADRLPWAPGRLPGIGHAHHVLGDPLPLIRSLPALGPVVRVGLGPRALHVVTTAELLRSIGLGTAGRFHRDDLVDAVEPFAGRTLVTLSGDAHRRRRRLLAPAFHRNRIAGYATGFARVAEAWVDALPVGEPVDLAPAIDRLAFDTLTSSLFSSELAPTARDAVRVDSPLLLAEASFRTALPRPVWGLRPGATRRFLRSSRRMRDLLAGVVRDYRASRVEREDLLSTLTAYTDPETGDRLDDEAIVDELVGFLMGGIESPSGILVSLVHELVRAPGVRDRLVAEVDEVVGDRPVEPDDATRLPYLRAVLQETMRLWAPWINVLTAHGPVTLGDVTLPGGAMVGFSANMIHHDPRYYLAPESFRPERWSDPELELVDPTAVVPFGVGARRCPGDLYSWSALTLQAAALLRRRLPVAVDEDSPVGVITKGVGIRPSRAEVVLYPRG